MNTKTLPISDFIRKFGMYADMLPSIDAIILTRDGRPFATLKTVPEIKNKQLLSMAGVWKGTELDSDAFWKKILKRRNKASLRKPL